LHRERMFNNILRSIITQMISISQEFEVESQMGFMEGCVIQ